MDWRRKKLSGRGQKPAAARTPKAVYDQAEARLAAAIRSVDANAQDALASSLVEVERLRATGQRLDEPLDGSLRRIWSDMLWVQTAQRFAAGEATARDAMLSIAARTRRRQQLLRPDARRRFDLAAGIQVAQRMRPFIGGSDRVVKIGDARGVEISQRLVPDTEMFVAEEARQRFIHGEDVEELAAALGFANWSSALAYESIAGAVIAAIDPVVGYALASTMVGLLPSLPKVDRRAPLCPHPGLVQVVERATTRMCCPKLPHAYRQLLADIIVAITAQFLTELDESEASAGHPVSPTARIYWTDHFLAGTFRADSAFYGQGAADSAGDEEGVWRAEVFRLRRQAEQAVWSEVCVAVLELHRDSRVVRGELDGAAKRLLGALVDSPTTPPPAGVHEALARGAALGLAHGWIAPAAALDASPGALELWLSSRPGVAVLSSFGAGFWCLIFVGEAGELIEVPLERENGQLIEEEDDDEDDTDDLPWFQGNINKALWGRADLHGVRLHLEEQISAMLTSRSMAVMGRRIGALVRRHRLSTILVLAPPEDRTWPWEVAVVDEAHTTLAERVSIVHVHSLLPGATREAQVRPGTFRHAAAGGPAGEVSAAIDAAGFTRACQTHGVLRLFVAAEEQPVPGPFPALICGEDRLSGPDILALDLTGCGRVELWACPVGDLVWGLDLLTPYVGPEDVEAHFQLAGARVVVGCPWPVPEVVASLLSAAFAAEASAPGGAAADARALASAVRKYRIVTEPFGIMDGTILRALLPEIGAPGVVPADDVLRRAFDRGWEAGLRRINRGATSESDGPGPLDPSDGQKMEWAHALTSRLMEPLRASSAWSGWRVYARDVRCL